jgi:hypothetical protein
MYRSRVMAAVVAVGALSSAGPGPSAAPTPAPQLAQAVPLAGEWASSEPCAASASRLRFAGSTLAFFSGARVASEYEVEITDTADGVRARVVRVITEPAGPGGLAPGTVIQYRRDGEDLRLVGVAMPGGQLVSPTVATLYRRCK